MKSPMAPATLCLALSLIAAAAQARVTRIVIDETLPMPAAAGAAYEQIAGRAFGELDPTLPANAIIQDIELAKDADGKVRYVAIVRHLTKPVDHAQGERPDVARRAQPRRARSRSSPQERAFGDIDARQRAGRATTPAPPRCGPRRPSASMQWLQVPVARERRTARRSPARCSARIVNRSGPGSQPLIVQTNPVPYKPVTPRHDARRRLVSRARRDHARRGDRRDGDRAGRLGLGARATPAIRSPARPTRRRSA